MTLKNFLGFSRKRSPQTKPAILPGSVPLTKSELAQLRQGKKQIIDYALKEFADLKPLKPI